MDDRISFKTDKIKIKKYSRANNEERGLRKI